ncbi:MAG: hypothetical protein QF824_06165 [Candidatus Woesearchaeota archaeon]|jgi:hypothetical protein|nr:hypothetical protein [Candidatus Woesearchaeota archaeon]
MTLRAIGALYKAGYDEVGVSYTQSEGIMAVQNAIKVEMTGFEIVEQGKTHATVRSIESGSRDTFDVVLRRTFILLLTMAEDSLDAIKNNDMDSLKRLRYLEESNNKLITHCSRVLSKQGYKKHNKIQFMYNILQDLEKIADQYKYLLDFMMRAKNANLKISKETIEFYSATNDMLRTYYELFYKFDKKKVVKIGKMRKKMFTNISEAIYDKSKQEIVVMHYLIIIMQQVFELVEPYLSLTL